MLEKKEFPILEFDSDKNAKIQPGYLAKGEDTPECCVIAYFGSEVIERLGQEHELRQINTFITCTVSLPVWELELSGRRVGLVQGFLGGAGAAGELEELIAMGFKRFIVCGGAGVLQRGIQVGRLVVPCSAVRDEGASYHYAPPSREIACNEHAVNTICSYFEEKQIPYIRAKTWTTDAFYRETEEKIALRTAEGCVTVEMEAAALFAVAAFRGVTLGQILFGGDDLSGEHWDERSWTSRNDIHRNLLEISLEIVQRL